METTVNPEVVPEESPERRSPMYRMKTGGPVSERDGHGSGTGPLEMRRTAC